MLAGLFSHKDVFASPRNRRLVFQHCESLRWPFAKGSAFSESLRRVMSFRTEINRNEPLGVPEEGKKKGKCEVRSFFSIAFFYLETCLRGKSNGVTTATGRKILKVMLIWFYILIFFSIIYLIYRILHLFWVN